MKYAFMSFSTQEMSLEEMLRAARDYGYDGIEPRVEQGHNHGIELTADRDARRRIVDAVAASPVEMCCIATGCRYSDPSTVAKNVDDTLRYIDLAADLRCPRLRIFGGPIPEGVSRKQAADSVVASMRTVSAHTESRGVTLCLETHDSWCSPDDVAGVMRAVDHPNIAVNWDIMHPVRAGGSTMERAFGTLRPWIRHVHFHDGTIPDPSELRPIGQGGIDHAAAIRALRSMNYDGYLSGEWIGWEPAEVHLPRELATMRRLERESA